MINLANESETLRTKFEELARPMFETAREQIIEVSTEVTEDIIIAQLIMNWLDRTATGKKRQCFDTTKWMGSDYAQKAAAVLTQALT